MIWGRYSLRLSRMKPWRGGSVMEACECYKCPPIGTFVHGHMYTWKPKADLITVWDEQGDTITFTNVCFTLFFRKVNRNRVEIRYV